MKVFSLEILSVLTPLSGGLFISPGKWIHTKRKIDSFEIIFVQEGVVKIFENDKKFEICPGELLLLYPGMEHGGTEIYEGKLSFYWLHFKLKGDVAKNNSKVISFPQHVKNIDKHRIKILFRQFLNNQANKTVNELDSELLILQILSEIQQHSSLAPSTNLNPNIIAEQVFRFIAEHYAEPISTSVIAHELMHNSDYLGRCFKIAYGYTITEEINRRRIMEAEILLIDHNLNLNEIALKCGFNDPSYFRKVFVRKNGITPGKFRQRLSRVHINTL